MFLVTYIFTIIVAIKVLYAQIYYLQVFKCVSPNSVSEPGE